MTVIQCYDTALARNLIHFSTEIRSCSITFLGSGLFTTALPETIMLAPAYTR